MTGEYREVPPDLPVPVDDGAATRLPGLTVPALRLTSTLGGQIDLAEATVGLTVVYVYPRTGQPGQPLPEGWNEIPGARGCTPQSCAFRDHVADLSAHRAAVLGVSAQTPEEQREFADREHIPYPLVSDPTLKLAQHLELPTFRVSGMHLYRRLTFIAEANRVVKVFYPVFPPEGNASEVLSWLSASS